MRARLFLITPRAVDAATFAPRLEAALAAGDVASLLIAPDVAGGAELQAIAEALVPIAQRHDVAALVVGDSRVMGRAHADGLHIETGSAALREAVEALQPKSIVGAGNLRARHEAMEAGEANADYVFFGLLDLDESDEPHRKTIDLGAWWAELFEPPCVLLAGRSMASVETCARTGADFVALRAAVWEHPDGPAVAVTEANAILDRVAAAFPDD
ncbi:thiamine phosphate synthase [Pleomorphomonas koreensis]|uniref:thiamine phosphate synthase n=1 Tax=Pleomorphomonas koreensis TaxID=257440 RepID=UPI0004201AEF|nr:thiamine phosphate synthase [Pleomorphomonas koreensis]